jgi:hypothetical protein
MMDEKTMETVIRICEKLHPIMQKHLIKLMDDHGPEVATSVVSSVVANLFAHVITMVEIRGGDIDQYVQIMMKEISQKQHEMSAKVQTQSILEKMILPSGPGTCSPLH